MTPEEIALAFVEGLEDRYQSERIRLRDALPALAALILAEQTIAARDEREACAAYLERESEKPQYRDGVEHWHLGDLLHELAAALRVRSED